MGADEPERLAQQAGPLTSHGQGLADALSSAAQERDRINGGWG
jgi:hypothetical protein